MSGDIIGIYVLLVLQLIGVAFAAGKLWQRVNSLEARGKGWDKAFLTADKERDATRERLGVLEGRFAERNSIHKAGG